eukprot:3863657-Pleurochrysis_carterae.AAC.1
MSDCIDSRAQSSIEQHKAIQNVASSEESCCSVLRHNASPFLVRISSKWKLIAREAFNGKESTCTPSRP